MTSTLSSNSANLLYNTSQPTAYARDVNRRRAGESQAADDTMTSRGVTSATSSSNGGPSTCGAAGGLTRVVKCTLDEDQCLSLQDILTSFQTAINEEQAWALCYQSVKCFSQHYQSSQCYLITDPAHLFIHKDGYVHQKSLFPKAAKRGTTNDGMYHHAATQPSLFSSLLFLQQLLHNLNCQCTCLCTVIKMYATGCLNWSQYTCLHANVLSHPLRALFSR